MSKEVANIQHGATFTVTPRIVTTTSGCTAPITFASATMSKWRSFQQASVSGQYHEAQQERIDTFFVTAHNIILWDTTGRAQGLAYEFCIELKNTSEVEIAHRPDSKISHVFCQGDLSQHRTARHQILKFWQDLTAMSPVSLKAFGGWPGIVAFYCVGLAFPLCYAFRGPRANDQRQIHRQSNELRVAGFIVFLSALLSFHFPSELYLQRHVAADRHMHARILDWTLSYAVMLGIAPILGFIRLRRTAKMDRDGLSEGHVDDRAPDWSNQVKVLLRNAHAQCYTESSWLFLFTLWFMNMAGGLLTFCIGHTVKHEIPWWLYPNYNASGHAVLLHAMVGLIETLFHQSRTEILENALECRSEAMRAAYWTWILEAMSAQWMFERILGAGDLTMSDAEHGFAFACRQTDAPDASILDEKRAASTGVGIFSTCRWGYSGFERS